MYNNCSKIKTYLGFAKRARKIVYGVDDIIKLKNFNCLILSSSNLSESSFDKLNKIAEKNNNKVYIIDAETFAQNIENEFIKAIAITDKSLSEAIKKELD